MANDVISLFWQLGTNIRINCPDEVCGGVLVSSMNTICSVAAVLDFIQTVWIFFLPLNFLFGFYQ